MQTITEILESPDPNALDFLDTIKLNLFTSEIFVFTPKGDIKTLPQGATALDFGYAFTRISGTSVSVRKSTIVWFRSAISWQVATR